MWTFWLTNVVHRSRQTGLFFLRGHPWQFHPEVARIPRLVPSTWWWLFKDGWRKTEASRYGIWLRPPASCESDSICLNVWAQAERKERKEPSLSSEIWSSSYLRSGEEIPRCPHRSTGQRWYGELLQSSETQKTSSTFQPMKGELFICLRQTKQPFHTWMCPVWRSSRPLSSCVIEAVTTTWKVVFHLLLLPEGGLDVLSENPTTQPFSSYIWLKPTS